MWKVGQVMSVGVGDGAFGYGFNEAARGARAAGGRIMTLSL
jgi:hypothetical protein